MELWITKASGEKERFSFDKLIHSLKKSGAHEDEIQAVVHAIKKQKPTTTNEIHHITFNILQTMRGSIAVRYNLKRALMEFGPAGYPFEKYIGHLFRALGYASNVNVIIPGACVEHEVDVMISKDNHHAIVECKFHNRTGLKSNVKIPLYIKARFDDIHEAWQQRDGDYHKKIHEAWLVCNTSFTLQAIQYARCRSIKLLAWNYPHDQGLAYLIEKVDLHPVTALTGLSHRQKQALIQQGIVLCKEMIHHAGFLHSLGLSQPEIDALIAQAKAVCLQN